MQAKSNKKDSYKFFSYQITNEPVDKSFQNLPHSVQRELENILSQLKSSTPLENVEQIISRLKELEKQYPDVYTFSNYLTIIYGKTDPTKFDKFVLENYKKHPDYLFARLQYAGQCLEKNKLEKIKKIFKEGFDLKLMYPQRDCFHISEFVAFGSFMCRYYGVTGEQQQAEMILEILEEIAPDHPSVKQAATIVKIGQKFEKTKSARFKA